MKRRRYQTTADVEARYGVTPGTRPALPPLHRVGPLTTNQHILHLLLTVFTFGLWAPVWIVRAAQGNRRPVPPAPPPHAARTGSITMPVDGGGYLNLPVHTLPAHQPGSPADARDGQ